MILVCKDFIYDSKSLSSQNLSSLNFDDDTALPSQLSREMDSSTMNLYRSETNGFGIKYTETLTFDVHIAKNYNNFSSQEAMAFSPDEYDALVSWLSSPRENQWFEITTENNKTVKVKGYFSSINPYDNWGICYGAKCTFVCNSPFSYEEKSSEHQISDYTYFMINNESSELYDYVYPSLILVPTKNEEIFIHNTSDSTILDSGTISVTDDKDNNMLLLQGKISNYASLKNMTVDFIYDENHQMLKTICDKTGVLFYMTDMYGVKNKYIAYYLLAERQYFICRGGFFYCNLLKSLTVTVDCKNLGIYDSLDRPILFNEIGIQDEDEIYWPRLKHGNNSFRVFGHFKLSINHLEPRKGLLI